MSCRNEITTSTQPFLVASGEALFKVPLVNKKHAGFPYWCKEVAVERTSRCIIQFHAGVGLINNGGTVQKKIKFPCKVLYVQIAIELPYTCRFSIRVT